MDRPSATVTERCSKTDITRLTTDRNLAGADMIDQSQAALETTDLSAPSPLLQDSTSASDLRSYSQAFQSAGHRQALSTVHALFDNGNPFTILDDDDDDDTTETDSSGSCAPEDTSPQVSADDGPPRNPCLPPLERRQPDQTPQTDRPEPPRDMVRRFGGDGPIRADTEAFRQRLQESGINPDSISTRIGLYEPIDAGDREQLHPRIVQEMISDRQNGLSRGADARIYSPTESTPGLRIRDYAERTDPVAAFVTDYAVAAMGDLTQFINQNLLNQTDMRVLNVSQGFSPLFCLRQMRGEFERDPEAHAGFIRGLLGEERGNQWVREQRDYNRQVERLRAGEIDNIPGGPHDRQLDSALDQVLVDRITASLRDNPRFNEAMEAYRTATRRAAQQGNFVVVAAANDGFTDQMMGVRLPEGAVYNWYAMSDHVISVGGSDPQGTPFDRSDDTTYGATSPGTARYHPDVLAHGSRVPSRFAPGGSTNGTSFAAPLVSGCIGLMLEQNPNLTFDQVRQILRDNATPLRNVPERIQGAGILEIDRAVIAARESAGCLRVRLPQYLD